jgi:hypothetical protein
MIKLNTASLREFQKRASVIEKNTLLPVLSNVKIEISDGVCLITKSSLNAICVGQVQHEGDNESVLVDEKTLFYLAGTTASEWIKIEKHGTSLVLSDEKDNINLPTEAVENFPPNPPYDQDAESFLLEKRHIDNIDIARSFVDNTETSGSKQFVHVRGNLIFAVHGAYFFINEGFENLPSAMFTTEETAIICQHEKLQMAQTERHHIFFADEGFTYIFIKPEGSTLNAEGLLSRIATPGKNISFLKEELVNFCNLANVVNDSPVATCSMNQDGLFMKLQMNDKSYGKGNDRFVVCEGECDEFNFNSRLIVGALKAVPHAALLAKTLQNNLIINTEKEWYCFIGMQKTV